MIRSLLFAFKIGLLAVAAVWVSQRPGTIEINWLDYHITAHIGLVLLLALAALLFILVLHRLLLALSDIPKALSKKRKKNHQEKGFQTLTRGLTAVAAGDSKQATLNADKVRRLWPEDKGLSLLLEAQAARLRGEEDVARSSFQKLLENKDTAFLGLRGLLVNALERGDTAMATELAEQAQKMHPRQPWIISMLYDLEIQEKKWLSASKTLDRAKRFNAIDEKKAQSDKIALLLAQGLEEQQKGNKSKAIKFMRSAALLDPGFVPAALLLADAYIAQGKKANAKTTIKRTWQVCPHPALASLWGQLMPSAGKKKSGSNVRLNWYEKLVTLCPDNAESYLVASKVAIEEQLWEDARRYLEKALDIEHSARLCKLYAHLEEQTGDLESAKDWLEQAGSALASKVWVCKETGQIYESWSPVAKPHGSFNTIIWDYPKVRSALAIQEQLPQNELLLIAK